MATRPETPSVTYEPLPTRTVLNRSSGRRVRLDLTVNPYRGCEFGCRYCFARYTHEFLDHQDPLDFERQLYAKLDAPQRLREELRKIDVAGRSIAIGTATDPYQPLERRLRITRGILEALTATEGARISVLTKSALITRDLDIYQELARRHELTLAFTLVALDRHLVRKLEPKAPTPQKRLAAMGTLAQAGLRVGFSMSPLLPGVNDGEAELDAVVSAAAEHGASFGFCQTLWMPSCARPVLFGWLEETFPEKLRWYRFLYRDGLDAPEALRKRLHGRFAEALTRHGLTQRWPRREVAPTKPHPVQLSLFEE